jgi:hypothetical protein
VVLGQRLEPDEEAAAVAGLHARQAVARVDRQQTHCSDPALRIRPVLRDLLDERAVVEAMDRLAFLRTVGNPESEFRAHELARPPAASSAIR